MRRPHLPPRRESTSTEDPASSGMVGGASAEDAAAIARAAEVMDLGIDVAGLNQVAWNALSFYEYDDGGATISASAQQDSLDVLRSWLDAEDWSDWTVQDATEGEPCFTFRWLGSDGTYLGIQDPEGQDGVSFEFIYVPAAG